MNCLGDGGVVLRAAAAWLLILTGLLVLPLPLPLGLLMIVAGVALVANRNRRWRAWLRRWRSRHPAFSLRLRMLEARAPALVRRLLRRTDPARRGSPLSEEG